MNKIITVALLSFFSLSFAAHPQKYHTLKKLAKNRYKEEKQKAEWESAKAGIAIVISLAGSYIFKSIMNEGGLSKTDFMQQKISGLPVAAYAWIAFGAVDASLMVYATLKGLNAYYHDQNAKAALKEKENAVAHIRVKREDA